jgi:hypothetical protein
MSYHNPVIQRYNRQQHDANGVDSTVMSEHKKHTEFLRQCLLYDESAGREQLMREIAQIQRDLRCVQRAAWLMGMLGVLVVVILGYGTILVANFPYNTSQFIFNLIIAVGVGILISFLAFVGLWMFYRWKLDLWREECRQTVTKLLESRMGKPPTTSWQDNHASEGDTRHFSKLIETAQENLPGRVEQENKS